MRPIKSGEKPAKSSGLFNSMVVDDLSFFIKVMVFSLTGRDATAKGSVKKPKYTVEGIIDDISTCADLVQAVKKKQ
jgi:hypothetical protein